MATGANIQQGRGIQVTNLPPQVDLRTGDAEVWQDVRRVADRFTEAAKPDLIRRAQARGAEEGAAIAAGEMGMPKRGWLFGGDVAEARTQALQTAYMARTRTDIEARDEELRREFRNDPEGYERAAATVVSGFIQGSPPEFAVDVETYARARAADGLSVVANARSARDEQEVVQALGVRAGTLAERLAAIAADPNGGLFSAAYIETYREYETLQDERENNPSVLYSTEQRAQDDERLFDDMVTTSVVREAVADYTDADGGPPGTAAAERYLRENVLEGDLFADASPERRSRLHREARTQLNAFLVDARAQQKAVDDAERERVREGERIQGAFALRIALGDAPSTEEIQGNALMGDDQKATLVRSVAAMEARAAAQARRDTEIDESRSRAIYDDYRDQAYEPGGLQPWEIAQAIENGEISRGQGARLQTMSDRTLRPIVDTVMIASRERAQGRRNMGANLARAEENAADWARLNPDADLALQLSVSQSIAERHMGGARAGAPTTPAARDAQRLGGRMGANAEIARRRAAGERLTATQENAIIQRYDDDGD